MRAVSTGLSPGGTHGSVCVYGQPDSTTIVLSHLAIVVALPLLLLD